MTQRTLVSCVVANAIVVMCLHPKMTPVSHGPSPLPVTSPPVFTVGFSVTNRVHLAKRAHILPHAKGFCNTTKCFTTRSVCKPPHLKTYLSHLIETSPVSYRHYPLHTTRFGALLLIPLQTGQSNMGPVLQYRRWYALQQTLTHQTSQDLTHYCQPTT
jgi:hypothetical protein